MQDEGILAFGLDQAGQVGLFHRGVYVRVAVVLEDPEVPVQPDIDAGGLDQVGLIRVELDPAGLDLGLDVTIGEEHPGNLPGPVRCLGEHSADSSGRRPRRDSAGARGCSSMVERQLPKLIVRVRFPSPAPRQNARSTTSYRLAWASHDLSLTPDFSQFLTSARNGHAPRSAAMASRAASRSPGRTRM